VYRLEAIEEDELIKGEEEVEATNKLEV